MSKYHLTNEGPKPCNATYRPCPLGENVEHFSTFEEGKKAYEERMIDEYGEVSTVSKSGARSMAREEMQQEVDVLEEAIKHFHNEDYDSARETLFDSDSFGDLEYFEDDELHVLVNNRWDELIRKQEELDY